MTTTFDLERRLRLPAPDEPAVLPPLLLPTDTASVGRAATRWRLPLLELRGGGLAYVVVLLLLLAAVLVVGSLRERQAELTPLGLACQPDQGPVIGGNCASVAIPDGWATLASGQIYAGDFTEVGLGYEIVDLVIASVPLGDCPTTPGPFPTAIPVGSNSFEQPQPTPDPGLYCLRDAPLPPNAIRIETMRGSRIVGLDVQGAGIPDTSEPTAENGWTEVVAGRPAKLTVIEGSGGPGEPGETRTWDVIVPGSIDQVIRIRADIAGPDLGAGRATARAFVESLTFATTPQPLDDGAVVLERVLDQLDRSTREQRSDFYACFPRLPGSADGMISGGPGGSFGESIEVTCSSEITRSGTGVWRIMLDVSWEETDAYAADTIRMELFTTGQPIMGGNDILDVSGGYLTSLAGRPMPNEGPEAWFPAGNHELPPPLEGPLNLPPGSLVKMLPPGDGPADAPGEGGQSMYPGGTGTHLYVLDGPEVIDGEEWYRVQVNTEQFPGVGWVRGTRAGRPQLAIVEPACPPGDVTIGNLTWLIPAERLACFGGRELTFESAIVVDNGQDVMCLNEEGSSAPCADPQRDWLSAFTNLELYDEAGPTGPYPPLLAWVDPSLDPPPIGEALSVMGRFDHPGAPDCRWPDGKWEGSLFVGPPFGQLICRERFVITAFETR